MMPERETLVRMLTEYSLKGLHVANPLILPHKHESSLLHNIIVRVARSGQRFFFRLGKPMLVGACILANREPCMKLGGFDESIILGEDVEFERRAKSYGASGLLSQHISVSMRRLPTMRDENIIALILHLPKFLRTGKVSPSFSKHYLFGHY